MEKKKKVELDDLDNILEEYSQKEKKKVKVNDLDDVLKEYSQKERKEVIVTSPKVVKKEKVIETKNIELKSNNTLTSTAGVLVLFVVAIVLVVLYSVKIKEVKNLNELLLKKTEEVSLHKSESERTSRILNDLLDGKSYSYVEKKLDLMDEYIVFQIEGYGNYYYTYDCMMKKVGLSKYSYWAYNKEQAIGRGLKAGSC